MTPARDVLVVAEVAEGQPSRLACETLGLARALADAHGAKVHACALGDGLDGVAERLVAYGADVVHVVEAPGLEPYLADAWLPDLAAVATQVAPAAVIAGHSPAGADFGPRLAFRLGTTIATACHRVAWSDATLLAARACYGGKAEEVVSFRTSPAVVTAKPRCFRPFGPRDDRRGEIVRHASALDAAALRTRIRASQRDAGGGASLETAATIVAGGGGMKGPQGFELAARLAALLGGAVGASRVACDLGWCPPSWQIGLSGKTVAPDLYIAIGISGAGQHMAGCANAKTIVAINTDRDAPIFRYAKYGVVGDAHELMRAMIGHLEQSDGAGSAGVDGR